jgi:ABC-type multidrug transport system fused ATPase/permease subunit
VLFNDTIKNNIIYGTDNVDDKKIYEVAEMANALGFIEHNLDDIQNPEVQK